MIRRVDTTGTGSGGRGAMTAATMTEAAAGMMSHPPWAEIEVAAAMMNRLPGAGIGVAAAMMNRLPGAGIGAVAAMMNRRPGVVTASQTALGVLKSPARRAEKGTWLTQCLGGRAGAGRTSGARGQVDVAARVTTTMATVSGATTGMGGAIVTKTTSLGVYGWRWLDACALPHVANVWVLTGRWTTSTRTSGRPSSRSKDDYDDDRCARESRRGCAKFGLSHEVCIGLAGIATVTGETVTGVIGTAEVMTGARYAAIGQAESGARWWVM